MFPTYTQHTEGELFVFHTKEGGREEYSSSVRVNPVRFVLILKEERNIPAESELIQYVPTYTQHIEGEPFVFHTEEGGREEYSSSVRVNPVRFVLILKEERNIPAESELIQYVSYLYSTY